MIPDLQRNLLTSFFQNEFKDSRDYQLRLSLLFHDVQAATRVYDRLELLFDDKYFYDLSKKYEASLVSQFNDEKESFFLDMHLFQVTLYALNHSGFNIQPIPDSDKLDLKDSEFKYTAYNITLVCGSSCDKFVRLVLDHFSRENELYLVAWLVFLADHLEFKL